MHISGLWKEARARYSTRRKLKPGLLNFSMERSFGR